MAKPSTYLSLDVGQKRVGLAIASTETRWPRPHTTLLNDATFSSKLVAIIQSEAVGWLIVGLPRGLDGQETAQTGYVRTFVRDNLGGLQLPIIFQDEALTSQKAKAELEARGKIYQKPEVDALAATYILEDYLNSNQDQL